MTEQPAFLRRPTDIVVFLLNDETIPQLIEETGITDSQWRNVWAQDQQFGLQSKVYVVPSEVRWLSLLHKMVDYYFDEDDDLYAVGFTADDIRVMKAMKTQEE